MRDWVILAVLYVVVFGLFRWFGGLESAGRAFRDWGRWNASVRRHSSSSSGS